MNPGVLHAAEDIPGYIILLGVYRNGGKPGLIPAPFGFSSISMTEVVSLKTRIDSGHVCFDQVRYHESHIFYMQIFEPYILHVHPPPFFQVHVRFSAFQET